MICRRRLSRSPFVIFLTLSFFVMVVIFLNNGNDKQHKPNIMPETQQNTKPLIDIINMDEQSKKELARLESFNLKEKKQEKEEQLHEREELMHKYNETLRQQEEENDPFKPQKEMSYVDFINFHPHFVDTEYSAADLRSVVNDLNARQIMYNSEKFSNLPEDHPVIVIQVHKRIEYFKELLDSLQKTRGIENSIIVISHDYYSDTMNALIRLIHFAKVIQIFFPFSLQLYPDRYPGQSKDDCSRNMKKVEAIEAGCINAEHPDKYGHYREAHITMTKHHWWWKINTVFDRLDATSNHKGPFIFMEEDHYVAPSFYEALMALHELKQIDSRCKDSCDILTLGSYNNKDNYQFDGGKVIYSNWLSSQHNMGMAMYRDTWEKIKKCSNEFCTFDDYNWDWTLLHISKTCMEKKLTVLVYEIARMFHVGDCGLHHTKACGDAKSSLKKVKGIIERNRDFLFTDKVNLFSSISNIPNFKDNGGWGDVRDHELCHTFVKTDESIMKR